MTFFPLLRVVIIGKNNASGLFEYLIAAIPDFLIIGCLIYLLFQARNSIFNTLKNRTDQIILFVLAFNLIIGSLLSYDLKLIVMGIRLSYIPILFYFISRFISPNKFMVNFQSWLHYIMVWFSIVAFMGLLLYYFFPTAENMLNKFVGGQQGAYFIKRMNSLFFSPTTNGIFCCVGALYFLHNSLKGYI